MIHRKTSLYQSRGKSGSIDYTSLNALTLDISNTISSSRLKYHEHLANKLNDPKTVPKTCNDFFAKQCTPITNDSTVPVSINSETRERLSSLEFSVNDIVKVIRSLDQNKAHGHDGISVQMIKLCVSSISKPLHLIFRNYLETE